MTDATLRRLWESDKGRDVARAYIYTFTQMLGNPDEIAEAHKRACMIAFKKDGADGCEILKATHLINDIQGNDRYIEALIQQVHYRRETLINVMTSAWLYENYVGANEPLGEIDINTAYESEVPSKCSVLHYIAGSEYGVEQFETARDNRRITINSLKTIAAHNTIIGLVGKYYKIPEVNKLQNNMIDYNVFCDDYNAARKPFVNIIEKKYKGAEIYSKLSLVLEQCFGQITTKNFIPDEAQTKKALSEIKKNDGRSRHYYSAMNSIIKMSSN